MRVSTYTYEFLFGIIEIKNEFSVFALNSLDMPVITQDVRLVNLNVTNNDEMDEADILTGDWKKTLSEPILRRRR